MEYDVKGNLREVLGNLPEGVRLVAISKFHPNEYIEAAYDEGQRIFGESHEQELARKVESLPKDIEWHFIGHLQTNKVKYIAPYISMIESVDSLKLLKEINKHTDDEQQIAQEFDAAYAFFKEVKEKYFADDDAFCERSWGMSHDYRIAVKHGSNMVRVGTTIFGPRIY